MDDAMPMMSGGTGGALAPAAGESKAAFEEALPVRMDLSPPVPNPATSGARFRLAVPRDQWVTVVGGTGN